MQKIDHYRIDGAEVKEDKNGVLIVGFSSQTIDDDQLVALKTIEEDYFLVFYGCDLSKCNLTLLAQLDVRQLGLFHSSFSDKDLNELSSSKSLELLKLHDTLVTPSCISDIHKKNPKLKIFTSGDSRSS